MIYKFCRSAWLACGLFLATACLAPAQDIAFPSINSGGIVDAASFAAGQPVAAGSMVAIFGDALAAQTALADTVPFPYSLADDVSVTFDGIPAPVQYVSDGQINVQVPWNVLPPGTNGTVNVVVTREGVSSFPEPVAINQVAPGVYQAVGHAFAIIANNNSPHWGKFAAPMGAFPADPNLAFPAQVGDSLMIYASGLGAIDIPVDDGANSMDQLRHTVATPFVMVNGIPANVTFSGLSPQYPGVYQVNIVVPPVSPGNALPLQIQMSGLTTTITTTIAVQ